MIVVDTNIISYFYLTSEFSSIADKTDTIYLVLTKHHNTVLP